MDKVQAVVDFVNLMTYDFRTSDPIAGHHANLYLHPADAKKRSVDSAVREFIAAGVPPTKVVVGVPFYGRAWAGIKGEGTGPYQPGSRPTARIETNYGPCRRRSIDRGGFVRMWDSQAQAPYLWNKETRTFISYDDPESLRLKMRLYPRQGVGGHDVLGVLRRQDRRAARYPVHVVAWSCGGYTTYTSLNERRLIRRHPPLSWSTRRARAPRRTSTL